MSAQVIPKTSTPVNNKSPRWVGIHDASAIFGLSKNTLHRLVARGAPCIRLTRKLLFNPSALEGWLLREHGSGAFPDGSVTKVMRGHRTRRARASATAK